MTRIVANIPAPSGFRDGRPWLEADPPTWLFPKSRVTLAEGEIPVRIEGQERPIGRVVSTSEDEYGFQLEMEIEPRVAERLIHEVEDVWGSSGGLSIA